jgi:hypothetical protein
VEPGLELLAERLAEEEAHAGVFAAIGGEERRQEVRDRGGAGADADLAGAQAGDLGDGALALGDRGERSPSAGQEGGAGGGEGGAGAAAVEEAGPDLALEAMDRRGQRRLREVGPARGLGERAVLGDQHEVAELVEHV